MHVSQIVVKHKSTEEVFKVYTSPITRSILYNDIKALLQVQVIIIEDANHNEFTAEFIFPPAVIYICAFNPVKRKHKRRSSVEYSKKEECKVSPSSQTPERSNPKHFDI